MRTYNFTEVSDETPIGECDDRVWARVDEAERETCAHLRQAAMVFRAKLGDWDAKQRLAIAWCADFLDCMAGELTPAKGG